MKAPRPWAVLSALALIAGVVFSVMAVANSNTPNADAMRRATGLPSHEELVELGKRGGVCLAETGKHSYTFRHVSRAEVTYTVTEEGRYEWTQRGGDRLPEPTLRLMQRLAQAYELGLLFYGDLECPAANAAV